MSAFLLPFPYRRPKRTGISGGYCRSTTIPYIDGITDGADDTREARDPVIGKTVFVEGDLNYEEWYNKYVVKGENKHTKPLENDKIKERRIGSI
ncbi:hypothetical protein [uncultured Megasphaera sp.]|uniref:hypothetical protein n=1 Tax=uncultured Megasphaera sp. TaxID=165188 RepID=UPI002599F64F|nr:hypothetical protein [uncultured Megasphaera sp.]